MKKNLFSKDFTLVVIGQIISLFGNAALCFALPLYLLNLTGSAQLYGTVTACALIPSILLSPVGGIIADRVNKRNIMAALDFSASALVFVLFLLIDAGNPVLLLTAVLMALYGIAGAYRPAVQAAIPALAGSEHLIHANAVINSVNSLASLLGPALGGVLFSACGLKPLLLLCAVCFALSAVMELFIYIPYTRPQRTQRLLSMLRTDFGESLSFIFRRKTVISKSLLIVCAINFFLSAMLTVGLPYLITEVLPFSAALANRLCGFAEGALAAGGLAGGICAGIFASRLAASARISCDSNAIQAQGGQSGIQYAGNLLIFAAALIFPMGIAVMLSPSAHFTYAVLVVCCFLLMALCSVFTIQVLSFVQAETPEALLGKVISVIMTVSMCAQPLGCALYGILFERCRGFEEAVILFSAAASLAVALPARALFKNVG